MFSFLSVPVFILDHGFSGKDGQHSSIFPQWYLTSSRVTEISIMGHLSKCVICIRESLHCSKGKGCIRGQPLSLADSLKCFQ